MGLIRRLDRHVINQIAAGEVIERPASVIKELVENSLDAQAKHIEISWRHGGQSFLQVTDDGHGMDKDDVILCPERHATSKWTDYGHYLGFRGEALSSIGAVARLTIESGRSLDEPSWQVEVINSAPLRSEPGPPRQGTCVKVTDLFGLLPVRLKFLQPPPREHAKIVSMLDHLAMAHPECAWTYLSDQGKDRRYPVVPTTTPHEGVHRRMTMLWGEQIYAHVQVNDGPAAVWGWLAPASAHRALADRQWFYVNGRWIREKMLSRCLDEAYRDIVPAGRHVAAVLFITWPQDEVDINVHPTKSEVRFREAGRLRHLVVKALHQAVRTSSIMTPSVIDASAPSPALSLRTGMVTPSALSLQTPPCSSGSSLSSMLHIYQEPLPCAPPRWNLPSENLFHELGEGYMPIIAEQSDKQADLGGDLSNLPPLQAGLLAQVRVLAQFKGLYVLAQYQDNLVVVDQHAAHERIVYERMKHQLRTEGVLASQSLLAPEWIAAEGIEIGSGDVWAQHGFVCAPDQGGLWLKAIPSFLTLSEALDVVYGLLQPDILKEDGFLLERMFANKACRRSIRGSQIMNIQEMQALLKDMSETPNALFCNHGRPTCVWLEGRHIDTWFERYS